MRQLDGLKVRGNKDGRKLLRGYELGGGGKWNHSKKVKAKAKGKRNLKRAA